MSDQPLVSVIVPVYNVKPYLHECLESIVSQTYQDLEIIVVDDGSTDGSGELCDEWASADRRVFVFHKENGGLADARNFGLRQAHGDWISFVDSDDWVSSVFIEALVNAVLSTGCQIAAIPFGKPFKDGEPCSLVESLDPVAPPEALRSADVQRLMLYQALDTGAQWRLYGKAPLGQDPFPKGLYYEDLASVYRIIHRVDRVALVDCRELYAYRLRPTSIIRQPYRHVKAESALRVSEQLYREIDEWYPELLDAAASRCFSVCRMVFAQVPTGAGATDEMKDDREALWTVLKRHRGTVLHDPYARKRERLAAAIACMGKGPFSAFCGACRRTGLMR